MNSNPGPLDLESFGAIDLRDDAVILLHSQPLSITPRYIIKRKITASMHLECVYHGVEYTK